MADGQRGEDGNSNYFNDPSNTRERGCEGLDEENDETSVQPDIGLGGNSQQGTRSASMDSPTAAGGNGENSSRREDNPFSFKHFLSRGSSVGGARPKVYPTPTPPPSPSPRLISNPEMTSGLPDFVQDHLVIEQCYLNSNAPPQLAVDLESIPPPGSPVNDFGPGRGDIPFDLTRRERCNEVPLDLPSRIPFDLPRSREPPPPGEVGSSKSLPDFLSDGPIRNERRLDQMPSEPASPSIASSDLRHSPDHRLQIENERLRRELDSVRRQLSDHITRGETLEAELCVLRSRGQSDTAALEKVIEQVEDNLKRATKRAVCAESQVSKLREEVRSLTCELNAARSSSRCRDSSAASSSAHQTDNERLASQLRNAANNAELSLRHLLLGVDNLRQLASSLEPHSSIKHHTVSSSDESLDENEPGPAL